MNTDDNPASWGRDWGFEKAKSELLLFPIPSLGLFQAKSLRAFHDDFSD